MITTSPLKAYITRNILPAYNKFDGSHRRDHAEEVIKKALWLGQFYKVNQDIVYTAAAYHDLGLSGGRGDHHLLGGRIVRNDRELKKYFDPAEIEIIAQAVEDHRISADNPPRSIYGKIISEADRVIDCTRTLQRTIRFGISSDPKAGKEKQISTAMNYISQKYGLLKIWIPESPNLENLQELQKLIRDKKRFREELEKIYEKENGG